ncbi:MAG: AAA family ATPase [Candidatus Babeliales bacterium]
MIPLKLQIKNFLSYGSQLQEINFGNYPLICLSGKNGHGKSALLDAMTWALWGQARKTTGTLKPDAQLLRLGQTSMLVIFDFYFNNQTYRVRREFALTRNGNPYASLEFGVLEQETDTLKPLTEKTIRGTQETIEKMLGLSFETFVNTAFLRQGQANEFSKKSPKERKEILASILQLDTYESIRKAALDKAKQAVQDSEHLKQLQERLAQDVAHEPVLEEELKKVSSELEQIALQEKNLHQQQQNLEQEKIVLAGKEQERARKTYELEQQRKEQKKIEEELLKNFTTWRSVHKKQKQLPSLEQIKTEKSNVAKKADEYSAKQSELLAFKELYLQEKEREQTIIAQFKEQYLQEIHKKQLAAERLASTIKHQEETLQTIGTQTVLSKKELEAYSKEQEELKATLALHKAEDPALEKQFEKRKYFYHTWVARANIVNSTLKELEQKKGFIQDPHNPSCPLCEQNLSASRKKFLKAQFAKQEQTLRHQFKRFSHILPKLKELLVEQHKQIESMRSTKESTQIITLRLKELQKKEAAKRQEITALSTKEQEFTTLITALKQEYEALKQIISTEETALPLSLEQHETYKQQKKVIQDIIEETKALNYKSEEHKKAIDLLQALTAQEEELLTSLHQISQQEERKKDFFKACAEFKIHKKDIRQKEDALKAIHLDEQKNTLLHKEQELHTNTEALKKNKEALVHKKGSLEQEQKTIQKQKTEYKEHQKTIESLIATHHDYAILATALSKDGVQALLIEDALPEIEYEANNLLAELTNNQAHIIIESLRDLKKGGTKETLDIKISDPMGIRPYELFSGGEAFRIDFALRIAISKLLARRAGTSLQTLIIDEGFGSQDEEGLNHIMDAILKIQDNFAKVIIVSHLPTMKDQFPVHFFVNKATQGSFVTVIEQG